jgi:hypothetical protein
MIMTWFAHSRFGGKIAWVTHIGGIFQDIQGRRQTFVAESTLAGPRRQSARDAPLIASSWSS